MSSRRLIGALLVSAVLAFVASSAGAAAEGSGISLSKAAQMIGTNVEWVRRVAIEKGFIEPRKRWKGAPITLSEQTVEIIREQKDKWLNLEETASRLGVEVTSMKRLLDAGHLDGITSDNPRVEGSAGSALWRISPDTVDGFVEKLVRTLVEARALADRDRASVRILREGTAPVPLVAVPRFSDEIHDLRALWRAGSYLLGEAAIL